MSAPASVIVCTRGRPAQLAQCLAALRGQDGAAEIVVVENGPVDPRVRAATETLGGRYVHEPRTGSAVARNRGLRAVRADLVAYVDDDCIPEPGWLAALRQPFGDPAVQAVSGQVVPTELRTPPQQLFDRFFPYSKGDVRRTFGPGPRPYPFPLNANEVGTGANMAFRRPMLKALGGFVNALSAGGPARGGEDIQAFYAVLRAGGCLVYEPSARVRHPHPDSTAALDRTFFDYGVGHFAYLTHCLLSGRDWRAVRRMAAILVFYARRLGRPNGTDLPRRYLLRHVVGSCLGPACYLAARWVYG